MLFRRDLEGERRVWVDRGIDSRVDRGSICSPCDRALLADDPDGQRWHDAPELCPSCRAGFAAQALAADLFGLPRPLNGMLEDRVLTNDELAEEPPSALSKAFDYFLPTPGDGLSPGRPELVLPDPDDYLWPGDEDYLLLG